jgi:hypothetical protein
MKSLRELLLILSTFAWLGGAAWFAMLIIASDPSVSGDDPYTGGRALSLWVFGLGVTVFVLTSILWKKGGA